MTFASSRDAPAGGAAREERILFVHAHPDDESISTGGTIATLIDAGVSVTVLTCTRGELGEVTPPELSHLVGNPSALATLREGELANALRILGVTDHRWLGSAAARMVGRNTRRYLDSGMVWGAGGPEPVPDLSPDALCSAELGEIAADIATVIATTGADIVVSYDENGGYGHPDHIVCHRAAARAASVMSVPFYAIERADVDRSAERRAGREAMRHMDVSPVLDRKLRALRSHRSQLTVDGDNLVMAGGQRERIPTVESFRRVDGPHRSGGEWSELTVGKRIAWALLAVLTGATVGALATVTHQAQIAVLGVSLPIGVIGGLLVVAALLTGFRLVLDSRIVAGLAAAALLGMIGLLSLESVGGSVLIPASPLAYYWIYGPVLIAAVVLAWPKFFRPARDTIGAPPESKGAPAP